MIIEVRTEKASDLAAIHELHEKAFGQAQEANIDSQCMACPVLQVPPGVFNFRVRVDDAIRARSEDAHCA
jgi:hypothetical protein